MRLAEQTGFPVVECQECHRVSIEVLVPQAFMNLEQGRSILLLDICCNTLGDEGLLYFPSLNAPKSLAVLNGFPRQVPEAS